MEKKENKSHPPSHLRTHLSVEMVWHLKLIGQFCRDFISILTQAANVLRSVSKQIRNYVWRLFKL